MYRSRRGGIVGGLGATLSQPSPGALPVGFCTQAAGVANALAFLALSAAKVALEEIEL